MTDNATLLNRADEFVFAPEEIRPTGAVRRAPWKVIIADDEEEVHALTHMVLGDFSFGGQGLEILNC